MPDREHDGPAVSRRPEPLDLAHLDRQTLGDERLRRDVLAMFAEQAAAVGADLARGAGAEERRRLAHGLAGSARAVGAFALADGAAALEAAPQSAAAAERVGLLIEEVRAFIAEGQH